MRKYLPIGRQSFSEIADPKANILYIDKTELVHRMVTSGKTYFLARPRRFGKSLLVSTLEALFQGRSDLFAPLWIGDKIDWATMDYTVVRLTFAGMTTRDGKFAASLDFTLGPPYTTIFALKKVLIVFISLGTL